MCFASKRSLPKAIERARAEQGRVSLRPIPRVPTPLTCASLLGPSRRLRSTAAEDGSTHAPDESRPGGCGVGLLRSPPLSGRRLCGTDVDLGGTSDGGLSDAQVAGAACAPCSSACQRMRQRDVRTVRRRPFLRDPLQRWNGLRRERELYERHDDQRRPDQGLRPPTAERAHPPTPPRLPRTAPSSIPAGTSAARTCRLAVHGMREVLERLPAKRLLRRLLVRRTGTRLPAAAQVVPLEGPPAAHFSGGAGGAATVTVTEVVTPAPDQPFVTLTLSGMSVPTPAEAPLVAIEMRDAGFPLLEPRVNP